MNNKGVLYIVGTPIGNLKDITYRAIETLQNVEYIACEDTRQSQKLLNHFSINNKKLISYHNFNEQKTSKQIIEIIKNGFDVALISDAGMPTIADPGFEVIQEAKNNLIKVEVVPGVSALTTAMSLSGMGPEFTFLGFGKQTKSQLINQLKSLTTGTYVFFVAPHKLEFLLIAINENIENNQVFIAKELTKIHEETFCDNAKNLLKTIKSYKGEFTLVLKIPKIKRIKENKYKKD